MSSDKIIVTTCVALWGGTVSALVYDMMSGWTNSNNKNKKTTQDGELSVIEPSSCGCPFASVPGVALTGGVLTGALTWIYYKN